MFVLRRRCCGRCEYYLQVLKAQLEATLVNYEANKSQLESAQLLKFQALSERDRYMEMTSALQKKLLDKEEVLLVSLE